MPTTVPSASLNSAEPAGPLTDTLMQSNGRSVCSQVHCMRMDKKAPAGSTVSLIFRGQSHWNGALVFILLSVLSIFVEINIMCLVLHLLLVYSS